MSETTKTQGKEHGYRGVKVWGSIIQSTTRQEQKIMTENLRQIEAEKTSQVY